MAETDFDRSSTTPRRPADRTSCMCCTAMHTMLPWRAASGMLAVIALIVNYVKRDDEHDTCSSHHTSDGAPFWWTVLWLVLYVAAVAAAVPVPG